MSAQAKQAAVYDNFIEAYNNTVEDDMQQLQVKVEACDFCGDVALDAVMKKVDEFTILCPQCQGNIENLPDGILKKAVKQYLLGNVI